MATDMELTKLGLTAPAFPHVFFAHHFSLFDCSHGPPTRLSSAVLSRSTSTVHLVHFFCFLLFLPGRFLGLLSLFSSGYIFYIRFSRSFAVIVSPVLHSMASRRRHRR